MDETDGGVAVLSSFLAVALDTMATPEYEDFFNCRKFNQELIAQLKAKLIDFSLIIDSAEEKQFIREEVRKWLLELKDATYEAEDLLDGIHIEYQAHQSNAVNGYQSQDPLTQVLESKLTEILQKLGDLVQRSAAFGLKKAGEEDRSSEKTETPSSSARPLSFEFDVFLNFRSDDVRYGFAYDLKEALEEKKFSTFYYGESLRKGEEIAMILKKIEVSKISIIIFSADYASSSYCLEELVKILDCKKRWGHKAVPVFYKVPPDVVANQSGIYEEAFRKHGNEKGADSKEVLDWRKSLKKAAEIAGHVLENKRPEILDIRDIVGEVEKTLAEFDK